MFKQIAEKLNFKINGRSTLSFGLVALSLILVTLHLVLRVLVTNPEATTANIYLFFRLSYPAYWLGIIISSWFISKEIKLYYLLQLLGMYLLYLLGSYFLTVTRNLNNGDFRFSALQVNGFYQTNFLPTLLLILALGIGLRFITYWLRKKSNKSRRIATKVSSRSSLTISCLMAGVLLTDSMSFQLINRLYAQYLIIGFIDFSSQLISYLVSLFIIYGFLSYFILTSLDAILKNRPDISLAVASSFLFGLVFNYWLQYGVKQDAALMDMYIFPAATAYQIILIFILSLLVYLLINRYLLSTLLVVAFWSTVSVINDVKMSMRNEPMLFTDFSWIKQIGLVMEFVSQFLIIGILAGLGLVLIFYLVLRKRILPGKVFPNLTVRLTLIALISTLLASSFLIFRDEKNRTIRDGVPIISQLNNNYNAFWLDLSYHARYRSLLFVWTKQLTAEAFEKPSNYSKAEMEKLSQKYQKLAQDINKVRKEYLNDQTVVFILSESYANPNRLEGISISQDIMPNIKKIMAENTSGTMKSDAYGGGTANMEWQSLVGLPMYNMSESISTINTEVVPSMADIPSISDLFEAKNRIAIHLGDARTYSRNILYMDKLGFSNFIAEKNGTVAVEDFYRLGLFPSDDSTYKTILEALDISKNQFFSIITYQNHIPYQQDQPEELTATSANLTEDENDSLTSFARLMYYTDQETQKFLKKLSELDKKVTVVFYGDHLPGFYPSSQFEDAPETQYETDYFIWSNYQTVKQDYPYLNSSDFPAAVLAHTNSKVSPYYALLTKVLEEAGVGETELSDEQEEIAEDLRLVEYDLISGRGYLNNMTDFFEIAD